MEQSFSLKGACLLFKSIFIVNKKLLVIYLIVFVGIVSILGIMDIIRSRDGIFEFYYIGQYVYYIIIGSFVSSGYMSLAKYRNKQYVNTSHLVPASTNEKLFVPVILGILSMTMLFVSVITVLFLFWYISGLVNGNTVEFLDMMQISKSRVYMVCVFVAIYSITCLFSVLTKRFAWSVVFICILAIVLLSYVFSAYEVWLMLPYITSILTLLSWTIMYFQFRKIEIKK